MVMFSTDLEALVVESRLIKQIYVSYNVSWSWTEFHTIGRQQRLEWKIRGVCTFKFGAHHIGGRAPNIYKLPLVEP